MNLTGNKDTDILILFQLSDKELGMVCSVNKYVKKLCDDPSFWRKKLVERFKLSENDMHSLEKYLDNPKELYIFLTTKIKIGDKMVENSSLLPVLRDPKIIEEIEKIIKTIIPDEFPIWINKRIFLLELRKKILIMLFLYKNTLYDSKLYIDQIWSSFNIWKKLGHEFRDSVLISNHLFNKIHEFRPSIYTKISTISTIPNINI